MFERYTEKARRVIFFARYEASQFGSPYIEAEHMLLGLLREDKILAHQFLGSHSVVDTIRTQIEKHSTIREKLSVSVDLPLSHESKRVLTFAAEESGRNEQKHIGTIHLLAGLLREEKSYAAELLRGRGVQLSVVRAELERAPGEEAAADVAAAAGKKSLLSRLGLIEGHSSFPPELEAKLKRRAEERGIELQAYLNSLVEQALHGPRPPAAAGRLKERYNQLRALMAAEGSPSLDAADMEDEIARRKGVRRDA